MEKLNIFKKVISFVTCSALSIAAVAAYPAIKGSRNNASAKTIAEIQEERKANTAKIEELQSQINSLEGDKENEQAYQSTLYEQIGYIQDNIDLLNKELENDWREKRGLLIEKVAINSATISEADTKRIQEYEDRAWNTNPTNAAATLIEAQANAMNNAANNPNGAAMGFFGMGMAQQAGGFNAQNLFAMGQQQNAAGVQAAPVQPAAPAQPAPQAAPAADSWTCSCGTVNSKKFCSECGKPKPAPVTADGWVCECGAVNKGKFCSECGKPKPAGAPLYRCDKCGWEPADPYNPPKFCEECGDPFNDEDIVK